MNSMLFCVYCSEPISAAPLMPENNTQAFGVMLTHCNHCNRVGPSIAMTANHMLVRVIALQQQLQCDADPKTLKRASVVVKLVSAIPFYASEQR